MARKKKSSAAPLERAAESLDETSGAQSGVADAFEDQIESACRLALIHYQQEDRCVLIAAWCCLTAREERTACKFAVLCRAQAIESLRALTNTHPKAHLPHRYMVWFELTHPQNLDGAVTFRPSLHIALPLAVEVRSTGPVKQPPILACRVGCYSMKRPCWATIALAHSSRVDSSAWKLLCNTQSPPLNWLQPLSAVLHSEPHCY